MNQIIIELFIYFKNQINTLTNRIKELEYDNARLRELLKEYFIKYILNYRSKNGEIETLKKDLIGLKAKVNEQDV